MILRSLSLLNYKNFETKEFEFDQKINCLVGRNGVGKTNVLDAIYHLSFGKSYFNPITLQNMRHGTDYFVVDGSYWKAEKEERVVVSAKKGQKKMIKRNGKAYDRMSDHIGVLPLVIISPSDRDLITEGSDVRRKFVDGVIAQSDKPYLQDLLDYNRVLAQRNSLLKFFAANNTFNLDNLEVYNEQLDRLGSGIHQKRKDFIETFIPIFEKRYAAISTGSENVSLEYHSQLHDSNISALLKEGLRKDRISQYTNYGIHKDDLLFMIDGHPIKKFGSQGQQKSYLIALKLAQFDFIKEVCNEYPILLLDDIFDKLDEERVARIIQLVDDENFGQLFLSDTHSDRTEAAVQKVHQSYKVFELS